MINGTKALGGNGRHALVTFLLHVLFVFPLLITRLAGRSRPGEPFHSGGG